MIPKVILQTWHSKNLDPPMAKASATFRNLNPDYEYRLFDDSDIKRFLETAFPAEVIEAYFILKPKAFRADLFRYCYLYQHGGVYFDMDFSGLVPLKRILGPTDTFVSAWDRKAAGPGAIFQAFLACVPRHPVMKEAISMCVYNIQNRKKFSKTNCLNYTGPGLFGKAWQKVVTQFPELERQAKFLRHHETLPLIVSEVDGFPLMITKFKGYQGQDYGQMEPYHDSKPKKSKNMTALWIFWILVLVLVSVLVLCLLK